MHTALERSSPFVDDVLGMLAVLDAQAKQAKEAEGNGDDDDVSDNGKQHVVVSPNNSTTSSFSSSSTHSNQDDENKSNSTQKESDKVDKKSSDKASDPDNLLERLSEEEKQALKQFYEKTNFSQVIDIFFWFSKKLKF